MRALAGVHPEMVQAALHDGAGLGNVAPLHRYAQRGDAGTPAAVPHEYIIAALGAHPVVEFPEFGGHLPRLQRIEARLAQIHEIAHPLDPARTDGAAGGDDGAVRIHAAPVHLGAQPVRRDGAHLQDIEDGGAVGTDVQVGRELDLHAAADLPLHDAQQFIQDVREREGVVFEDMGEGDELRALRDRGIHHPHVLVVIGGDHLAESTERPAVRDRDAFQVDGVVHRCLELVRLEVQGEHRLLRLAHHQLGRGGLQDIARILRREAQHLVAVHDGLAQAEGDLGHAVFRLLVTQRVEVHRTGHAGEGREEIPPVLAAADLLQDDRHLLLREHVGRGRDVPPGGSEIHGSIDALDGLGQQAELLVLVLRVRDHIG